MKKKATDAEITQRVLAITDLISQGASRSDIVQFCSSEYGVSDRHTATYLSRAYKIMRQQAEELAAQHYAIAIARYTKLYAKNYKVQDFRECRNVQQAIDKITILSGRATDIEKPADPLAKLRKVS